MELNLERAAGVLGKTNDEVMFLVQQKKLKAGVDSDTLAWTFNLDELLKVKSTLNSGEVSEEAVSTPELLLE